MTAHIRLLLCLAPVLVLLAAFAAPAAAAEAKADANTEKPVHLFILSGQSNMVGLKHTTEFLPEAKRLLPDAEVLCFKVARGGQPIRLWVPEWGKIAADSGIDAKKIAAALRPRRRPRKPNPKAKPKPAPKTPAADPAAKKPYTPYYPQILAQARKLLAEHPRPASITFCWMQGERDAKESLSAAYAPALKQLIANLRRDLNRPDMNFVIGRISDCLQGQPHWDAVRQAHVDVATQDPRGAWVDTDDCNNKVARGTLRNDLHYTREGYGLFGRRLAHQALALIQGTEPDPTGRPKAAGTIPDQPEPDAAKKPQK